MSDITLREDIRIDDIHRAFILVDDHDTEVYISITTETGGFTFSRYMEVAAAEAFVAMIQRGIEAVKANIARGGGGVEVTAGRVGAGGRRDVGVLTMSDTFNMFMVGARGDDLVILNQAFVNRPISKDRALVLAAWLAIMADDIDLEKTKAIVEKNLKDDDA